MAVRFFYALSRASIVFIPLFLKGFFQDVSCCQERRVHGIICALSIIRLRQSIYNKPVVG
jgi:hypothetical protein